MLAERLPTSIAESLDEIEDDPGVSYKEYQERVSSRANHKRRLQQRETLFGRRRREATRTLSAPAAAHKPTTAPARLPTPQLAVRTPAPAPRAPSQAAASQRVSAHPSESFKCYSCGGVGHMKKDCPNARIAAMYAAAEEQDEDNDDYHDAGGGSRG